MSYIDKIIEHVENLSTLEIRTVVGNFTWDEDERRIAYIDEEAKVIITQINLVDGDITTAFSEEFLEPPYDKIREFHAEREKPGHEIIEANIRALKEFIDLIMKMYEAKKEVG